MLHVFTAKKRNKVPLVRNKVASHSTITANVFKKIERKESVYIGLKKCL